MLQKRMEGKEHGLIAGNVQAFTLTPKFCQGRPSSGGCFNPRIRKYETLNWFVTEFNGSISWISLKMTSSGN